MKIYIIVPVYNEAERLPDFLRDLKKIDNRVVIVDDGSTDSSSQILHKLENKKITVLTHGINLGKGAALKTGCKYAFSKGAEAVIFMDSDGQHLVSDLPEFIEKLEKEKYEVVLGSRNLNLGVPLDRYLGNKIASILVSVLFGIYVSDLLCGFRAMTKNAYTKIKWDSVGYGVEVEQVVRISKSRIKYCEVPVETVYYDKFKGVSINDAFGILGSLFLWKFSIRKA